MKATDRNQHKRLSGPDRIWGYESNEWLKDTEAAELLGVSREWVWTLGSRGKIRRGKDSSGRWYYCKRSCQEYRQVKEFGPDV